MNPKVGIEYYPVTGTEPSEFHALISVVPMFKAPTRQVRTGTSTYEHWNDVILALFAKKKNAQKKNEWKIANP